MSLYGILVAERDGIITGGYVVYEDTAEEWAEAESFFQHERSYGRTLRRLIAPHPEATFTVRYVLADALAEGWIEAPPEDTSSGAVPTGVADATTVERGPE